MAKSRANEDGRHTKVWIPDLWRDSRRSPKYSLLQSTLWPLPDHVFPTHKIYLPPLKLPSSYPVMASHVESHYPNQVQLQSRSLEWGCSQSEVQTKQTSFVSSPYTPTYNKEARTGKLQNKLPLKKVGNGRYIAVSGPEKLWNTARHTEPISWL